jgi:hypothetical protein
MIHVKAAKRKLQPMLRQADRWREDEVSEAYIFSCEEKQYDSVAACRRKRNLLRVVKP